MISVELKWTEIDLRYIVSLACSLHGKWKSYACNEPDQSVLNRLVTFLEQVLYQKGCRHRVGQAEKFLDIGDLNAVVL